jgi:hypothetical protein
MSICVISQPRFFPGLHYLHRMMIADIFVILDTVQFTPRHEENRTKLKTPQGPQWLTVPMRQFSREQPIRDTHLDNNQPWQDKAIKMLNNLYSRTPNYKTYAPEIISLLEAPYKTLTQLDRASWEPALRLLGITCEFVYASDLPMSGRGPQLLLDICKYLEANIYLSGAFGREYLNRADFAAAGVEVRFHEYNYPVYPQRFGDFVPFLSYLDMLFNIGLERDKVRLGDVTHQIYAASKES